MTLSQTGIGSLSVLEYLPQYPLYSDGSQKRRWVWIPPQTRIHALDAQNWEFPVGTKFWKEFSLPRIPGDPRSMKKVETRFMVKVGIRNWAFATYLWDTNETQAQLAPAQGIWNHWTLTAGRMYRIPSRIACTTCHQRNGDPVLGFNGLQLSAIRDGISITATSVSTLINQRLIDLPQEVPVALRHDAQIPSMKKVFGYFQGNCAHCHNPDGDAAHTGLFLNHEENLPLSQQPYFRTVIGQRTAAYRIPGQIETFRIAPGHPEKSAVLYRMEHGGSAAQMPPAWTTSIVDETAIDEIREFISQIN